METPNRFRFRAWDQNEKMMASDITLEYLMKQEGLAIAHLNWALRRLAANGLILMQSTGLLDRNGKEIFEGDIVRAKWQRRPPFGKVEYFQSQGGYMIVGMCDWPVVFNEGNATEVIGNVHENPDLLAPLQ